MNNSEIKDVIVVGAGLTGSIISLILAKLGYKTTIIDKGSHPRFSLGESSTYITAELFRYLGLKYNLPQLINIAYYEDISQHYRSITVGSKKYFQYMWHDIDANQLVKDATFTEVISEIPKPVCQYLRKDLDHYLYTQAIEAGAEGIENADIVNITIDDQICVDYLSNTNQAQLRGKFIIDATGWNSVLDRFIGFNRQLSPTDIPLKSRSIFCHFSGVERLEQVMSENCHFDKYWCVDRQLATQHHCFDGGWFWFIPFDNGITSVGLTLDLDLYPENELDAEQEFWQMVNKLPVVKKLLEPSKAERVYVKTRRLQFTSENFVGDRWAALSSAAFGLDAWQSSGLSTSLMSVDRLVDVLHSQILPHDHFDASLLQQYQAVLKAEYAAIAKLVHGVYKSLKHPELFSLYCLIPFIGSLSFMKDRKYRHCSDETGLIFNLGDKEFAQLVKKAYTLVINLNQSETISESDITALRNILLVDMKNYNSRNYGDAAERGGYFAKESEAMALI
jgi:tetracycline 7-halogenase / FADH2 O2-dependent halogenase